MSTVVHFIDVGQGNMVLIQTDSGRNYMFDCNITDDNADDVLSYVAKCIGWGQPLSAFICSHRDADHIRGVLRLHKSFPIAEVWDSGYPGTTTDSTEYNSYMRLRRHVGATVLRRKTRHDFGCTRFRYLSAADERLPSNANAQGIIIKGEHRSRDDAQCLCSTMLTGDSDAATWRYGVMKDYAKSDVSTDILMGGHHGSLTFFDDPADSKNYYTDHINSMSPAMSILSVGPNSHGHPKPKAVELYKKYSSGSRQGNKVFRTDQKGNMRLELRDDGNWNLKTNQ